MLSLVKHHFFTIDAISYVVIALLIAFAYLVAIPPFFIFAASIVSLPIIMHYCYDKNKVNNFMISLPVSTKTIIQSRYFFVMIITVIIIIFQGIIMFFVPAFADGTRYIYGFRDIIILLCMSCIIIAITMPIFQLFRSFFVATGIVALLYFIASFFILTPLINILSMEEEIIFNDLDPGFILLVENYLPYQPYLILGAFSIVLLYSSMKGSELLFSKMNKYG